MASISPCLVVRSSSLFLLRWVISAMEGGRGLVQKYLDRLLVAIQSYFQPANYNSSSEVKTGFNQCLFLRDRTYESF